MPPAHDDPDRPVPLVFAPDDFQAQVITQALNAAGIRAAVMGTHSQWLGAGNPLSPVNVMVRRAQRMEALGVLRRIRAEAKALPIVDTVPDRAIDEQGRCIVCTYDMTGLDRAQVCPECGTNLADDPKMLAPRSRSGKPRMSPVTLRVVVFVLIVAGVLSVIFGLERLAGLTYWPPWGRGHWSSWGMWWSMTP